MMYFYPIYQQEFTHDEMSAGQDNIINKSAQHTSQLWCGVLLLGNIRS